MRKRANPDLDPQLVRTSSLLARITFAILIIVVLYIGIGTWYNLREKQTAQSLAGQGQDLASQLQAECAKGQEFYEKHRDLCTKAADLESKPPPAGVAQGQKGDPGDTGPRGPQGDQGIPGPVGPTGQTGPQGPVGDTGAKGSNGDSGPQGEVGPKGDPGPQGDRGPKGDTGADGEKGKPVAGWAWPDPVTGMTHTCTRSNTDDDAPTYQCT